MAEFKDFLDSGSTAYVSVAILLFVSLTVAFVFLLNDTKEIAKKKRKMERDATQ